MHNHGRVYRAKIVSADGRTEHGEWFNTEKELRDAMQVVTRAIGKRYYCEAKMVNCTQPGCDVDTNPRVITTL
jgi:hypothetical protein